MTSSSRLYVCACSLLYAALSAEYFIYEIKDSEERVRRFLEMNFFPKLWDWTIQESTIFGSEAGYVVQEREGMMDTFTAEFVPKVWKLSEEAHSTCPEIDSVMWSHYFFCQSLVHILTAFESMMQEQVLRESKFYERYVEHGGELEEAKESLRTQHPEIVGDEALEEQTLAHLERQARAFSSEWLRITLEFAADDPSDQS